MTRPLHDPSMAPETFGFLMGRKPAHTNALDRALAAALRTAEQVDFKVFMAADDGSPVMYRVLVRGHGHRASGKAVTAIDALAAAMRKLTAAIGGAA